MVAQFRKLLWLLDGQEKRNLSILFVMMIAGAFLEVLGVAAVPAFVSTVVEPERLREVPVVGDAIAALGLTSTADLVIWGGLALIAIFALKTAFLVVNFYFQSRYVAGRHVALARRMANAYLRAPYTFHLRRNSAELVRNANREVAIVSNQIIASTLELATRVVILLAVLTFLFVVEPWITLYFVVFFGMFSAVAVAVASGRLKRYGQLEQVEGRRVLQAVRQALGGIKEVRVLNRERHFADRIAASVERIARVVRFRQFATRIIAPVIEFAAIVGLLLLVGSMVLAGTQTGEILVTLSLFVVGLVRLREALTTSMNHLASLRYNLVSVDPVYADLKLLEEPGDARPVPAAAAAPGEAPPRESIELRHVHYRYEADRAALEDINVTIPKGSAVGFVGSTGAGKSTLVDTLLALVQPHEGGVYVDGRDIRDTGISAWQRNVGYVPQSIYLLDDTIRSNIAFGIAEDRIDEVALRRAIRTAQLEPFVEAQPQGLDTCVGERGVRLSGGERQRIGIARALYHDPRVLVFDEATSSLDNTTEREVIAAVEALHGSRTVIMVAHRLTTLRNCDRLYFLKQGRIEASGSFDELCRQHPEFRTMATAVAAG